MSVNKVILIGNLTRDAEVRTVGQNQVAKLGLATSNKYRNASGETVEETEFHTVELWGNAGVHPYLVKGQLVFVEGSIKTDKWTDQQGEERSLVKIKAFTIQLLGSRPAPRQQEPQAQPPMSRQMYQSSTAQAPSYNQPPMPPQYRQPQPPAPQPMWGNDDLPM